MTDAPPQACGPGQPISGSWQPVSEPSQPVSEPSQPVSEPSQPVSEPRRQVSGLRRRLSALLTFGVVVGAWFGAAEIRRATPDDEAMYANFERSGRIGSAVKLRACTVRALSVAGGRRVTRARENGSRSLLGPDAGQPSAGLWVVVKVEFASRLPQEVTIRSFELVDRKGRRYRSDAMTVPTAMANQTLQPGLTVTGDAVFEVPPDAVAPGLSLHVRPDVSMVMSPGDETTIDLGVTDADRQAWSSTESVPVSAMSTGVRS